MHRLAEQNLEEISIYTRRSFNFLSYFARFHATYKSYRNTYVRKFQLKNVLLYVSIRRSDTLKRFRKFSREVGKPHAVSLTSPRAYSTAEIGQTRGCAVSKSCIVPTIVIFVLRTPTGRIRIATRMSFTSVSFRRCAVCIRNNDCRTRAGDEGKRGRIYRHVRITADRVPRLANTTPRKSIYVWYAQQSRRPIIADANALFRIRCSAVTAGQGLEALRCRDQSSP